MRKQGYSHPQLSSGYACRDKRWSGLIPSNKIESYHLLSSVALGSAQWERPHPKDTCTVTAFHCVSRTLGREIKCFCIRQAMCLPLQKGLCEVGAWEGTGPSVPKERRICYKSRIYESHLLYQVDLQNSLTPISPHHSIHVSPGAWSQHERYVQIPFQFILRKNPKDITVFIPSCCAWEHKCCPSLIHHHSSRTPTY